MDQISTSRDGTENKLKRRRRPRLAGLGESSDINQQTKAVIANVLNFVKSLNEPSVLFSVDFKNSQEVTAKLCGISLDSVQRCLKEKKSNQGFSTPRKSNSLRSPKTGLSDSQCAIVRETVIDFQNKGEIPTAEKVRAVLREKFGYNGSIRSVYRLLQALGLQRKKQSNDQERLYSAPSPITFISSSPEPSDSDEPSNVKTADQVMKECYDYFKQTSEADEYSDYGEAIAVRLRKINDYKRLCSLRNKIDNIIFEAELEDYDEQTSESYTHFLHGS